MIPVRTSLEIASAASVESWWAQKQWELVCGDLLHRDATMEIRELATLSDIWNHFSISGFDRLVILNYATLLQTRRDPTFQDNLEGIAWEEWRPRAWFSPIHGVAEVPIYCPNTCPQDDIYLCTRHHRVKVAYVGP